MLTGDVEGLVIPVAITALFGECRGAFLLGVARTSAEWRVGVKEQCDEKRLKFLVFVNF
ncbi:MAG: hypothetical protein AAGD01_15020 [Acidobacteriota bacterium]